MTTPVILNEVKDLSIRFFAMLRMTEVVLNKEMTTPCHPERSEGSFYKILRYAQNDRSRSK